jgi:hypothetical protein
LRDDGQGTAEDYDEAVGGGGDDGFDFDRRGSLGGSGARRHLAIFRLRGRVEGDRGGGRLSVGRSIEDGFVARVLDIGAIARGRAGHAVRVRVVRFLA